MGAVFLFFAESPFVGVERFEIFRVDDGELPLSQGDEAKWIAEPQLSVE